MYQCSVDCTNSGVEHMLVVVEGQVQILEYERELPQLWVGGGGVKAA
jgi:hypothetical protein